MPLEIFNQWLEEELEVTKLIIRTACCLSTIGADNYPNVRFVSFKGIVENNFIVMGALTSRKGVEITVTDKVTLSFCWAATAKQGEYREVQQSSVIICLANFI